MNRLSSRSTASRKSNGASKSDTARNAPCRVRCVERGNRRALTSWYSIYVEPEVVPSAVGPMLKTALIILALEVAVIGWVRRRYRSGARGELGEPSHPAATRV